MAKRRRVPVASAAATRIRVTDRRTPKKQILRCAECASQDDKGGAKPLQEQSNSRFLVAAQREALSKALIGMTRKAVSSGK